MEGLSKPTGGFKSNFEVESKLEPFYTGGRVQLSNNGSNLFCTCGGDVKIVDASSGKTVKTVTGEEDSILNFILSPDDKILVTASNSGLLRQWDLETHTVKRTWRSTHKGPINVMAFDQTVTLLATGGTDSTVKIWDIIRQYCTHNLKGAIGVFSVTHFHHHKGQFLLFGAADNYHIHVWNLETSSNIAVLQGHYSTVTSLAFSADGTHMLSSGRDQVVIIWDILAYKSMRTIPVFEIVEQVMIVPSNQTYPEIGVNHDSQNFITAGSKGILKVWSWNGHLVFTQKGAVVEQNENADSTLLITQAAFNEKLNSVMVVTYEHNILFYGLKDFSLQKQLVGFNDDILDIAFLGKDDTHFAVATNSHFVKVFDRSNFNCQLLKGHTDIVLALDTFPCCPYAMASCSKDNTIRLWKMDEKTGYMTFVGLGLGHTHGVGSVACSRLSTKFIVSGSQDTCLKLWEIPQNAISDLTTLEKPFSLTTKWTQGAHEKDINSVCVSPNDKLIATGSQDKSVKVWSAAKGKLLGALRGHRRGVWCVQFSSVDQVVASGSADGTIKIWSLSDFTCVKTFEGHDCSVLKLTFLCRGMQILSSASDGLIKLWTIKLSECVKTLDAHENKVWALQMGSTESYFISGAGDSNILLWKDVTEIEKVEEREKQEQLILQEQELTNLLQKRKFVKALGLAITLEQPFRALNIIKEILMLPDGNEKLEKTFQKLRPDQIDAIMRFAVIWNQNSKHCYEAQKVLAATLKLMTAEELLKLPNMKANLQGFLPYTERHLQRLTRLMQQATFLEYTWQRMKISDKTHP